MTVGVAFFDAGGGGGAVETGLLAGYTSSLWGAYGLSKLSSLYAGNCIRVRRSSDDAEQDIAFSGTALDTSSLASFAGSDSAYVVTWYDQSGGSNNFTQATKANQPLLVDAGTYLGEMLFDGTNDVLTTSTNSGTPTAFSVHVAGRGRLAGKSVEVMAFHAGGTGAGLYTQRATSQIDAYCSTIQSDSGTLCNFDDAVTGDARTYGVLIDRSAAAALEGVLYINGSAQSTVSASGSGTTGAFAAAAWSLGNYNSLPGRLAVRTALIYETAQSSGTFASISALIQPAAATLGLDGYTTNLWGAYSLRKLLTAYAGSSMRVRRSSDNTEQDIGFSAGLLDTAALLTFAGAGSAFVKTWYDQSGGAHDLSQSTTANQPRIVNSGVLDRNVMFDGTNDIMSTGNSGTPSAFTVFAKANVEATAAQVLIEQTTNPNTQSGCSIFFGDVASDLSVVVTQGSSSNQAKSHYTANMVGQVVTARFDRSQATKADQTVLFSGGAKLTRVSNGDVGTTPSGNYSAAPWFIGGRSGSVAPAGIDIESVVIYETAVTDANVDRISRALG